MLNELAPLGVGDFGWVSVFGGIDYDTRDLSVFNSPGVHVRVEAKVSPAFWDADNSFSSIEGEAERLFKVSGNSLLALRLGGRNVSGAFPFQESAYLGGRTNLRGFKTNRFAGDASVFGSVEFRGPLQKAPAYLASADYGWFVFADVGRVFFADSDDSDDLHPSVGFGLSADALDRGLQLSFSIARSEEESHGLFNASVSF